MDKSENQRSETYKAIAERLGSAATNDRPGAKARFASIDAGMMDGAGNEVVIRMADGSRATARYNRGTGKWSLEGHADVPAFAKVRDLVAHLTKQGMARPGAKVAMGRWETERTKRWDKPIIEHTAKIRGNSFRIEAQEGSSSGTLYLWNDMRGFERIQSGSIESLKRMAEQMGAKEARGVAAIERRANYSRPGAKIEFGGMKGLGDWSIDFNNVMKERVDQLKKLAKSLKASVRLSPVSPNGYYSGTISRRYGAMEPADLTAASKVRALIEELGGRISPRGFSRPGAKDTNAVREGSKISAEDEACLKVMSAADAKVSDKIRTLIAEGKPQKQAVAIALDLKRRGEL